MTKIKEEREWVFVGRCTKPHGIKGAFHFRLENTQDSVVQDGAQLFIKPLSKESSLSSSGEHVCVSKITFGHKVMAFLEGVNDRTTVEQMVPFEIYVDRESFPELSAQDNEFYHADLKGMEAFEFESGKSLGRVEKVYDNQAQAVLLIGRGLEAFEIPFVEAFVPKIDKENKKIWVVVPEYRD